MSTETREGKEAARVSSITEVSIRFNVSYRALRFYETRGLISPKREGGRRLYRATDIDRVAMILKLKSFGFSLSEIKKILARSGSRRFDLKPAECAEQLSFLRTQIAALQGAVAELEKTCSSA